MRWLAAALTSYVCAGCFWAAPSKGGGETTPALPRPIDAADVAVPAGYVVEVVASGLTFPTSLTFDETGAVYVVEAGYSYGEKFLDARLLRVEGGQFRELARSRNGPWTGVVYHDGAFYIAEGGVLEGGRIVRIARNGERTVLVEGLPSFGDHHTNGPALSKDGFLYFGQGTATNSSIVGDDNAAFGWLARKPEFHDVPGHHAGRRSGCVSPARNQGRGRSGHCRADPLQRRRDARAARRRKTGARSVGLP